ncbi:MAG: ABC transporter substrate-binding protein [Synergistaceae bacterium]|jgi:iron complex transport system substrate-binding protein|nr:ABC transporter substrate-binding protein [Synergistaceae bacterium]
MNKKVIGLLSAAFMFFAACVPVAAAAAPEAIDGQTVTDAAGNSVTIPRNLTRIAVTPIPWSSVISAIDGDSRRLVSINPGAMKAYAGSFFEKLDANYATLDVSSIGNDFSMNIEALLNNEVQAAIIWDNQISEAKQLREVGIVPVMVKNDTVPDLQNSFRAVGRLLGKEERAERFIDEYDGAYRFMKERSAEIKQASKPRVLYLKRSDLSLQGNDNFIKEALELAGADNIASDSMTITMEEIIALDPQIILLSDFDQFVPEDLYANRIKGQDWSGISAVEDKRVYKTPVGVYRWDAPGVETPLMMLWLGKMIQPEIFAELDMDARVKDFFKDIFAYSLTDDDMAQIFNKSANAGSEVRF